MSTTVKKYTERIKNQLIDMYEELFLTGKDTLKLTGEFNSKAHELWSKLELNGYNYRGDARNPENWGELLSQVIHKYFERYEHRPVPKIEDFELEIHNVLKKAFIQDKKILFISTCRVAYLMMLTYAHEMGYHWDGRRQS